MKRAVLAFLLLLGVAIGSLPAQTPAELWGGLYNLTSPTLINRQATTFQVNSSGFLKTTGVTPSFDPASIAIFNAMSPAPSSARKVLINNMVVSLKAATIWDDLDVFWVLAAEAAQNGLINWITPGSFTLVAVGVPTFTVDRGYQGDGSTSRLNFAWSPGTNGVKITQNDGSLWFWSRTDGQSASADMGRNAAGGYRIFARNASDNLVGTVEGSASVTRANTDGTGLIGIQRPSSSIQRGWRNGVQVGADVASTSAALSSGTGSLLGAQTADFSIRQQAAGAIGASLTGKELAFYNILNTYLTAIGASP